MTKQVWILIIIAAFITSCNDRAEKTEAQENATEEISTLAVADFETKAPDLVGKEIAMEGMVVHTCKHGGKRMFIIGDDPDVRIKIEAGENIASFNEELEGQDVLVTGVVKELKVDRDYLNEWEAELEQDSEATLKIHEGEEGHDEMKSEEEKSEDRMKIENYRKMLDESGKDHLSFYSVECLKYEVQGEGEMKGAEPPHTH